MNAVRKIIGIVLIVFFGLPILFGAIWAVGLIRATVSPRFLSDLPRQIIAEIPAKADAIFRDAQSGQVIQDTNTRAWFEAAAKTGTTPSDLLEKTGLLTWMDAQLSESLRQIGRVLRGERQAEPIVIDLRPLKNAILSPEVERFLLATLGNLPPCDEKGQDAWAQVAVLGPRRAQLPACRPEASVASSDLHAVLTRAAGTITDEVTVFRDARHFPAFPLGLSRTISLLSYILFLIPAIFIFFGAVIADSSTQGFLRWSGVSVFVGGLPALVLALSAKYFSLWALGGGATGWHVDRASELTSLILDKTRDIPERVIGQLLSPVVIVAVVVCLVGVVLFAVSFSVRPSPKARR